MWQAVARVSGNLELHRPSRLLIDNESAVSDIGPSHTVTDLELHEVTTAQLAVVSEVEQRAIAERMVEKVYAPSTRRTSGEQQRPRIGQSVSYG